jgi:chromosome segregation ATPase
MDAAQALTQIVSEAEQSKKDLERTRVELSAVSSALQAEHRRHAHTTRMLANARAEILEKEELIQRLRETIEAMEETTPVAGRDDQPETVDLEKVA